MTTETDFGLTPDQLAFIRAAAARWRMDEAGPMMLEALRKAEAAMAFVREPFERSAMSLGLFSDELKALNTALESVRAAIAAAE